MLLLLTLTILLVSTPIAYVIGKVSGKASGIFASIVSLIALLLVSWLAFGEVQTGITLFGLTVNKLSMFMALIPAFLGFLSLVFSISYMKEDFSLYYSFTLLFIGSMIGLALSWNLLWMYVFLEVTTISSAVLVAHNRESRSFEAALKYVFQSFIAGFLALAGIFLIYIQTGTFDLNNVTPLTGWVRALAAVLILVGFGIKIPLVFLHAWLPDAHAEAPSPISCLLSGAMIKVGASAAFIPLFKIIPLTPSLTGFNVVLAWLGTATMVIGVIMALVQHDLKRLLAYHSVSQMGYVVVGLSLGTPLGIMAGLFHALNHSLFKGLLFLGAGSVERATGTRNLDMLGGLFKAMPITTATMFVASLSISGVPLFNGFSSKWLIYEACIEAGQPLLAVIGMLVSAWTLISFMKVMHSVFFGLPGKGLENAKEPPLPMVAPMVILATLCILFGVIPELPIQFLLAPAAAVLTSSIPLVGLYPIYTQIGVWGPTYATLLAVISLIVGYVIYKFSSRPKKITISDKFLPFTGGLLTSPYLKIDEAHIPSSPFIFAADPVTRMVKRVHTGLLNHYLIWIILFFFLILLTFTVIGGLS